MNALEVKYKYPFEQYAFEYNEMEDTDHSACGCHPFHNTGIAHALRCLKSEISGQDMQGRQGDQISEDVMVA
jgi:hypothetical protein